MQASRNNVGTYLDVEGDVARGLRLGIAGRYEHFSDFGNTTNGKITARLRPVKWFVLRGAASSGFRAPSLGQIYFSTVSTNFSLISGEFVPVEAGTYPVASPQARALGSTDLTPENSTHYSSGVVITPIDALEITVDVYRISIDDRIVLSDNFTGTAIADLLRPFGANGARYFTNAIDTRTRGVDAIATYHANLVGRPAAAAGRVQPHRHRHHADQRHAAAARRVRQHALQPGPAKRHRIPPVHLCATEGQPPAVGRLAARATSPASSASAGSGTTAASKRTTRPIRRRGSPTCSRNTR